jgi:hypothetical protein
LENYFPFWYVIPRKIWQTWPDEFVKKITLNVAQPIF